MVFRTIISLFVIFALMGAIFLPQVADARAGGGMSGGSRGSRSYQSAPSTPSSAYGQSSGSPFMRGLFGGFLGAGLFSMLFGGGGGGFLPIILLIAAVYFIRRRLSGGSLSSGMSVPSSSYAGNAPVNSQPITVSDADKEMFGQLLLQIQHTWSEGDLMRLRQCVTPEMYQYFDNELAVNASHGIVNKVEQVVLQHANIVERWHENNRDYATAKLQWSAIDYMVRLDRTPLDPDYLASGSRTMPQVAEEVWTFVRATGGRWLLSAIQQVN